MLSSGNNIVWRFRAVLEIRLPQIWISVLHFISYLTFVNFIFVNENIFLGQLWGLNIKIMVEKSGQKFRLQSWIAWGHILAPSLTSHVNLNTSVCLSFFFLGVTVVLDYRLLWGLNVLIRVKPRIVPGIMCGILHMFKNDLICT